MDKDMEELISYDWEKVETLDLCNYLTDTAKNELTIEGIRSLIKGKWTNLKELFLGKDSLTQLITKSAREESRSSPTTNGATSRCSRSVKVSPCRQVRSY
jgi:hypothetical protein